MAVPKSMDLEGFIQDKLRVRKPKGSEVKSMAEGLNQRVVAILSQVEPDGLKGKAWEKGRAPGLLEASREGQRISDMVRDQILLAKTQGHRDRIYSFYANVAKECTKQGNFFAGNAIITALTQPRIERLEKNNPSHSSVGAMENGVYSALDKRANLINAEKQLVAQGKPVLPEVSYFLGEIIRESEGLSRFLKEVPELKETMSEAEKDKTRQEIQKVNEENGIMFTDFDKKVQQITDSFLGLMKDKDQFSRKKEMSTFDIDSAIKMPRLNDNQAEAQTYQVQPRGQEKHSIIDNPYKVKADVFMKDINDAIKAGNHYDATIAISKMNEFIEMLAKKAAVEKNSELSKFASELNLSSQNASKIIKATSDPVVALSSQAVPTSVSDIKAFENLPDAQIMQEEQEEIEQEEIKEPDENAPIEEEPDEPDAAAALTNVAEPSSASSRPPIVTPGFVQDRKSKIEAWMKQNTMPKAEAEAQHQQKMAEKKENVQANRVERWNSVMERQSNISKVTEGEEGPKQPQRPSRSPKV